MSNTLTMPTQPAAQNSPLPPGSTLILVTNRPLYGYADLEKTGGELRDVPGQGGVVAGLRPLTMGLYPGVNVISIGVAKTSGDREVKQATVQFPGGQPFEQRFVCTDPDVNARAHRIMTLEFWFASHGMFDQFKMPRFSQINPNEWKAFQRLNFDVASEITKIVNERGSENVVVLTQDYQNALVPLYLRLEHPDLAVVHFEHIPALGDYTQLPWEIARELAWAKAVAPSGWHTDDWVAGCIKNMSAVLPEKIEHFNPFADPLAADLSTVHAMALDSEIPEGFAEIMKQVAGRRMVLKVDRMDPTKAITEAISAFDALLERDYAGGDPSYLDDVALVLMVQPTRENLPPYRDLRDKVEREIRAVNSKWVERGYREPIVYYPAHNWALAAKLMKHTEVGVCNPWADGQNLVAHEMISFYAANASTVLVLSDTAGAYDTLKGGVIPVSPGNPAALTRALKQALDMPPYGRFILGQTGVTGARSLSIGDWADGLLAHAAESMKYGPQIAGVAKVREEFPIPSVFNSGLHGPGWAMSREHNF